MKRTLHPKPTPTARIVRTREEWNEIISAFDAITEADDQREYLNRTGASRSSVFRWKRIIREQASTVVTRPDRFGVERAIEIICSCNSMREELIDAVALFGSWLRWPASATERKLGAAVLIARYFSSRGASCSLSSMSVAETEILSRYISLDDIAVAIASASSHSADFWEFSDFYTKYSELDLITDTVGIMLASGTLTHKQKPSLERIFHLIQSGYYGEHYVQSKSSFNKLWKRTGAAAPFLFAERYDSYFKWRFAPFENDYADYVDEIMLDSESRRAYVAKGLWVINALRENVGANALAAVSFPAFPKWLEPMPIEGFSIDETARKIRAFMP